jgi:hypothetical protein
MLREFSFPRSVKVKVYTYYSPLLIFNLDGCKGMDVYLNARAVLTPGNNPVPIVEWLVGLTAGLGKEIIIPTSFRILNRWRV